MIWQLFRHQRIICASSAFVIFAEDSFFDKVFDVVQGRIGGAFANLGPSAGSEFAEEAVELHVNDFALTPVYDQVPVILPEAGLCQN